MTDWISFKKQQPKDGQFVLAYGDHCQGCLNGPKMSVWQFNLTYWIDANMDCEIACEVDGAEDGNPSHWMPLPESPL